MASENPFDKLGLKKAVVDNLLKSGRLDDYLKGFYRLSQLHLHPDQGGDTGLSAAINTAYSEIRRHPEQRESWIQSMHNGATPEHIALIEGLVARIEGYQRMEQEYELLRVAHAGLLAGSWSETAGTRTPRAGRARHEDSDSGVPPVREPRASAPRSRAEEEVPPVRAKAKPISLRNLVLYDVKGKPYRKYDRVTVAGEAYKDAAGSYITKTQDEWETYYAPRKEMLPSLPLLYAIIETLYEEKNPAAPLLLKELKDTWMCTSTRIDYSADSITHDYGKEPAEFRCRIPPGDHWLKDITGRRNWQNALRALLMCRDVDKAKGVLNDFSGVSPYIWAAEDRKRAPLRAAFVYVGTDRFYLSCFNLLDSLGCSRSVALE